MGRVFILDKMSQKVDVSALEKERDLLKGQLQQLCRYDRISNIVDDIKNAESTIEKSYQETVPAKQIYQILRCFEILYYKRIYKESVLLRQQYWFLLCIGTN